MRIGIFDSGIGGITILEQLIRHGVSAHFIYRGDTANLPYGSKSCFHIERLCLDNALALKQKDIDALIVACNTASSIALAEIQAVMDPVPVFGTMLPLIETTLTMYCKKALPVTLFATDATIRSGTFSKTLLKLDSKIKLYERACPLIVPFIEEGLIDHPSLKLLLEDYTYDLPRQGIALLGCTHYPWIESLFKAYLPEWELVNSATALANHFIKSFTTTNTVNRNIEWHFTDQNCLASFAQSQIYRISQLIQNAPRLIRITH